MHMRLRDTKTKSFQLVQIRQSLTLDTKSHRTLVETATCQQTHYSRCKDLFSDIRNTSHWMECTWSASSGGKAGCDAIQVDAQGAMLVLRRIRALTKQNMFSSSCRKRIRLIRETIIEVCKKEVGDRSLEGFDARQRLDEIEKEHDECSTEVRTREGPVENRVREAAVRALETCTDGMQSFARDRQKQVRREISPSSNTITACQNPNCGQPLGRHSRLVRKEWKYGNQDWSSCAGITICDACFQRFKRNGTFAYSSRWTNSRVHARDKEQAAHGDYGEANREVNAQPAEGSAEGAEVDEHDDQCDDVRDEVYDHDDGDMWDSHRHSPGGESDRNASSVGNLRLQSIDEDSDNQSYDSFEDDDDFDEGIATQQNHESTGTQQQLQQHVQAGPGLQQHDSDMSSKKEHCGADTRDGPKHGSEANIRAADVRDSSQGVGACQEDASSLCANPMCAHTGAGDFIRVRSDMVAGDPSKLWLVGQMLCCECFDLFRRTGAFDDDDDEKEAPCKSEKTEDRDFDWRIGNTHDGGEHHRDAVNKPEKKETRGDEHQGKSRLPSDKLQGKSMGISQGTVESSSRGHSAISPSSFHSEVAALPYTAEHMSHEQMHICGDGFGVMRGQV
jgi:hypothetical protein